MQTCLILFSNAAVGVDRLKMGTLGTFACQSKAIDEKNRGRVGGGGVRAVAKIRNWSEKLLLCNDFMLAFCYIYVP